MVSAKCSLSSSIETSSSRFLDFIQSLDKCVISHANSLQTRPSHTPKMCFSHATFVVNRRHQTMDMTKVPASDNSCPAVFVASPQCAGEGGLRGPADGRIPLFARLAAPCAPAGARGGFGIFLRVICGRRREWDDGAARKAGLLVVLGDDVRLNKT